MIRKILKVASAKMLGDSANAIPALPSSAEKPQTPDSSRFAEARKSRPDSAQSGASDAMKMNIKLVRKVFTNLLFISFIAIYASMAGNHNHGEFVVLENFITDRITGGGALYSVRSESDFWTYVTSTLIDGVFSSIVSGSDYYNGAAPSKVLPPVDDKQSNRLVGGLVFRTLRVQANAGCAVSAPFSTYYDTCYPGYSRTNEDTSPFGSLFSLPFESDAVSGSTTGEAGKYSGNGQVFVLSTDRARARQDLTRLRGTDFVDSQTRMVSIDINVYNMNIEAFVAVRVVLEQTASSKWYAKVEHESLRYRDMKPFILSTTQDTSYVILLVLLILLVLYYVAEEISELAISRLHYLKDGWNLIDWANLILLLTQFFIVIILTVKSSKISFGAVTTDSTAVFDMFEYAGLVRVTTRLVSVNSVLLAVKCLKYLHFLPLSSLVQFTVRYSWQLLVSFSLILMLVYVAFAIALQSGLHGAVVREATFAQTILALLRSNVGGGSLQKHVLAEAQGEVTWFGFVWLWAWVLVSRFFTLMIFAGIIAVGVYRSRAEQVKERRIRWQTFVNWWINFGDYIWEEMKVEHFMEHKLPGLYHRWWLKRVEHRKHIDEKRRERERREALIQGAVISVKEKSRDKSPDRPLSASSVGSGAIIGSSGAGDPDSIQLGPLQPDRVAKLKKRAALLGDESFAISRDDIIEASSSLVNQIAGRLRRVSKDIVSEMKMTEEALESLGNIVGVVERRVKDLVTQQSGFVN